MSSQAQIEIELTCPVYGEVFEVAVRLAATGGPWLTIDPDLSDVVLHTWTHEEAGQWPTTNTTP